MSKSIFELYNEQNPVPKESKDENISYKDLKEEEEKVVTKKEEPKEELKEEPKEEPKEELKEELKEEPKTETPKEETGVKQNA